jgi:hypothetical protein
MLFQKNQQERGIVSSAAKQGKNIYSDYQSGARLSSAAVPAGRYQRVLIGGFDQIED